ncbi:MAG: AMP-binding protein [Planctomycetes bacterium]|nr:AMP-binding protein [Planctomycetota bacterium]
MPSLPYLSQGASSKTAILDARDGWTYGELAAQADAVAGRLGALGGERIGLFLDRTKESIALLLGVFEAGGIAVPLSLRGTPRELSYQIADAGISRILSESKVEGVPAPLVEGRTLREPGGPKAPAPPPPDAAAAMLYTSGTTGKPKGVVHTHASLASQVGILHQAWEWTAEDRLLHVLPLHHVHGLINGALGALRAGAELRFLEAFRPAEVWERFAAREATVFYAVPTLYHQLQEAWEAAEPARRAAWTSGAAALRLAVSGSAALPSTLWKRWREITGQALLERYGMTEIGMALSNPYRGERRPGSVGRPLPGMEIRIVAEDGRDAPPGVPGEILVRGPSLFREYWKLPDATRDSFRGGYFLTGDVAEVDAGYVRIRGRASVDIIKSAGYKLSALEIEAVLLEHPAIREAAVVGAPDPEWGEVVTACVVLHPKRSLSLEELKDFCRDKLAPYKMPRRLRVLDALPRNAMGKVTKPALLS